MKMGKTGEFPDWEKLYRQQDVEKMPWYVTGLDPDLERALKNLRIMSGSCLDLGTGPGTHAFTLSRMGFEVTATDISEAAIKKASVKAKKMRLSIDFRQDDILKTRLDKKFHFIFDRGCFHVLAPGKRKDYVRTVNGLLKRGGYFFLKCFSHLEPSEKGPYRFTPNDIKDIFEPRLKILSIEETVYQGTLNPLPRAMFITLRKP